MIQRIQSVYLLIAVMLQAISLILNWSTYILGETYHALSGMSSTYEGVSAMPLMLGILVSIILLLAVIFQFKNRKKQMLWANLTMIQMLVIMGLFSWVHYRMISRLRNSEIDLEIGYGVAVVFPIVSLVLTWLAKKAIKKDDDLVRSADRLR